MSPSEKKEETEPLCSSEKGKKPPASKNKLIPNKEKDKPKSPSAKKKREPMEYIKKCIESKKRLKIVVKMPRDKKANIEEKCIKEETPEETAKNPSEDAENKSFPCGEEGCSAVLRTATALRKHKLVHAPKKFRCSHCKKSFSEPTKLRRHMLVHSGERSHKCKFEGCDRSFALEANLKAHQKTHTGEKPHKCSKCDHSFAHSYNLKVHNIRRHGSNNTD